VWFTEDPEKGGTAPDYFHSTSFFLPPQQNAIVRLPSTVNRHGCHCPWS
jgi:hypothetical protein